MAWVNPETGEKAFMVHGIVAHKLFIRSSPDEEPRIISDVVEIREFLSNIQSRILKPEYILLPALDVGDMVMWDNYGVFHSACDYPEEGYGPRCKYLRRSKDKTDADCSSSDASSQHWLKRGASRSSRDTIDSLELLTRRMMMVL
jgi:hypothetical protein